MPPTKAGASGRESRPTRSLCLRPSERAGDFSGQSVFAGALNDQTVADALINRPGCTCRGLSCRRWSDCGRNRFRDHFPRQHDSHGVHGSHRRGPDEPVRPRANRPDGTFQTVSGIHQDRTDQFTFKFDHRINDKQNFSVYYYFNDSTLFDPYSRFQAGGATVLGFGANTEERYQQWNLTHNWTISNTLVNEAHFTYFREAQGTSCTRSVPTWCRIPAPRSRRTPASVTVPPPIRLPASIPGLGAGREGVPFIDVSGLFSYGNNFEGEIPQMGNTFQWSDNLSWVKGSHTYKFGADVRRQRFDQTLYYNVNGLYSYYGGSNNDVGQR